MILHLKIQIYYVLSLGGRIWTDSDGFGRIWTDLDGFGQIWTDFCGFARICTNWHGFPRIRYKSVYVGRNLSIGTNLSM